MPPVTGHRTPVLFTEFTTLGKKPTQVGTFRQLIAVLRLVDTIAAHLIVMLAYRRDIDTLTWLQTDLPVVLGHARNDMVMGQMPPTAHMTILNPYIAVLLGKRNLHHGILNKDARMRFTVEMHDLTLVVDEIL